MVRFMMNDIAAIVLAAGKGTRMNSSKPKVMHKVAGKPIIRHIIDVCENIGVREIVTIIADGMDDVKTATFPYHCAVQQRQCGTGDAVKAARPILENFEGYVLVFYGDAPLLRAKTLLDIIRAAKKHGMALLGFEARNPNGYGRLLVNGDYVTEIIEQKDCSQEQAAITLCNAGAYCVKAKYLFPFLDEITNNNAQGEYYITDLVTVAAKNNVKCAYVITEEEETLGVNTRGQLSVVERVMQSRLRMQAMDNGVTMIDPETVYLSVDTVIAPDVVIEPNVYFGPGVCIGKGTVIHAFSYIEGAVIGENVSIGPYARIRPQSTIESNVTVGNFIEVNRTTIKVGSKAKHMSYLGDAVIGERANIGAGTVIANYDGFNKNDTMIGPGAFVGSNSTIIAPCDIGEGAIIAGGSTVVGDIEPNAIYIARAIGKTLTGKATSYRLKKSKG